MGLLVGTAARTCSADPTSSIVSVGVDTAFANNSGGTFAGEAPGQTFYAPDTLLYSLTVWRVAAEGAPGNPYGVGIDPYITLTDIHGGPVTSEIISHGPVQIIPNGDGIHPIKFEWIYDPPLVLPHRGTYAFFMQAPQDHCPAYWDLLTRDLPLPDNYPEGNAWLTARTFSCDLTPSVRAFPDADLVFTVEFCHDLATAVRGKTWGQLKAIYR